MALASLLLGDVANRIGRVLLQDLVGYLGRRYAYDDAPTAPPITVLIDEFGDVAFPLFTNALNKGGGAQARFILAQQSLADGEAAMGPAQARRVLDNLNTKIWCRLADDRTAAEATEGLGLCTVRLPDDGVGLSYGGLGGLTGSVQRRLTAREVPLVRPAWLTALPRGEALVRMKGEVWKLRVPLLTPPSSAVLRTMGLDALLSTLPRQGPRHRPAQPADPPLPRGRSPCCSTSVPSPSLLPGGILVPSFQVRDAVLRHQDTPHWPAKPASIRVAPVVAGLGIRPVPAVRAPGSRGAWSQVTALPSGPGAGRSAPLPGGSRAQHPTPPEVEALSPRATPSTLS